ncbi:MAG TPA: hypothetical protein VG870_10195 [Chitinophagaceae bacterium]|nr:hypothetical protein [Chitinophagaceae bacterium]
MLFEELAESGFIQPVTAFEKKSRDAIYRLTDEFSLFHLKFMEGQSEAGKEAWIKQDESPMYKIWCDMAFEAVCFKHLDPLKRALGIESIKTWAGAWKYVPREESEERGAQIDLVIDRSGGCINLCEMTCYRQEFSIDKSYALDLERILAVFKRKTGTRNTLFLTLISTFGLKENMYSSRLVQKSITMDALFS